MVLKKINFVVFADFAKFYVDISWTFAKFLTICRIELSLFSDLSLFIPNLFFLELFGIPPDYYLSEFLIRISTSQRAR